jgi:hypothetical protein
MSTATTHEHEVTTPTTLCLPDGRRLNPAALGWSRHPLLTANLRGNRARTKRWDYWAVLTDDTAVAITYGDVGYVGSVAIWWVDLSTAETGGREVLAPGGRGMALPDHPGATPLRFHSTDLSIEIAETAHGTRIEGAWTDPDGSAGAVDLRVSAPPGHESLNVVIPWTDRLFQYTSKHQARPAHGILSARGRELDLDGGWGVRDVGRGRWPYATRWNWGGGAGRSEDGAVVGIQVGGRWTVGTGATENGVIVNGRLTKIGAELDWDYDWDLPLRPWRVRHPDGSLDLTLTPRHDRHAKVQALVLATEVHQVFGRWSGHVTTEEGRVLTVDGIAGFAEESRSRW